MNAKPSAKRIDWTGARATYIEGIPDANGGPIVKWPTYQDIATLFNANRNNVEKRARRDGWPAARAEFRRRVEIERQDARAHEMARLGADLDVQALSLARNGLAITDMRIQELGLQAQTRGEQIARNEAVTMPPVDALEMDRLSRTASEFYVMGLRALGEAPRFHIEIEAEVEVTVEERDRRTLGILAILRDADVLPPEVEDVIDVNSGRLSLAAGNGARANGGSGDPEDQRVHPADPDGA